MNKMTLEQNLEAIADYLYRDGDYHGSEVVNSAISKIRFQEEMLNRVPETIYENIRRDMEERR